MKKRFHSDERYDTIALYALVVILLAAIGIKLIFDWRSTSTLLRGFLAAISPFLMGVFLAYILNPLVKFLETKVCQQLLHIKKRLVCRMISIAITYLAALGLLIMVLIFLVPQLIDSIYDLVRQIPKWIEEIQTLLYELEARFPQLDAQGFNDFIEKNLDDALNTDTIMKTLSPYLNRLVTTSVTLVKALINFLIALIVSIYLSYDRHVIGNALKKLLYACFSEKRVSSLLSTLSECNAIFTGFLSGKLLDSIIIGIICFLGMTLLDLPYILIISVIIGITNMIPYFGPWIGAIPGFLIILLIDPLKSLIYLIFVLVVQQFDGLYLGPRILGNSTGLRPVWIIFSITVGGYVGGILGMFLGVPCVAVLAHLLGKWVEHRLALRSISIPESEEEVASKPGE